MLISKAEDLSKEASYVSSFISEANSFFVDPSVYSGRRFDHKNTIGSDVILFNDNDPLNRSDNHYIWEIRVNDYIEKYWDRESDVYQNVRRLFKAQANSRKREQLNHIYDKNLILNKNAIDKICEILSEIKIQLENSIKFSKKVECIGK